MRAFALLLALAMLSGQASAELQLHYVAEVQSGRNATVVASVSSDETAIIPVNASIPCCTIETPVSIAVGPESESVFTLKLHAPLNGTSGYYTLSVSVGGSTKSMAVRVKDSDLVARIPGLTKYADSLRATMADEAKKGASMDAVGMLLDAANDRLAKARKAVQDDDENALYSALLAAERKLYYEAPMAISSASSAASVQQFLWVPALVIAAAAGLIMLRLRGI